MLGLICFVAGTYTVLMTQESAEHGHQVDIHPPGVDPIKPMAVHDSIQKHVALRDAVQEDNSTKIHVKGGPVDMDVAKVILLVLFKRYSGLIAVNNTTVRIVMSKKGTAIETIPYCGVSCRRLHTYFPLH